MFQRSSKSPEFFFFNLKWTDIQTDRPVPGVIKGGELLIPALGVQIHCRATAPSSGFESVFLVYRTHFLFFPVSVLLNPVLAYNLDFWFAGPRFGIKITFPFSASILSKICCWQKSAEHNGNPTLTSNLYSSSTEPSFQLSSKISGC